ncbi:FAD binding domain-containing protein [Solirubrobacter sp. CPCC 204708]|nr:FAD binding domain-containing protein [Solirubrobacter deserti]
MLPSDFELHRPATVGEAVALRAELGEAAALYAGGTELLLAMKLGVLDYEHLIDLKRIAGLRGVTCAGGELRIGAAVTHRELETHPDVVRELPGLAALERAVANVRVRAAGTLAGNLAFAEPHADPPALLVALGARVVLVGGEGSRELALEDFLVGAYETELGEDELIEAIVVPVGAPGAVYRKFQVLERPAVGVAAVGNLVGGVFDGAPTVVVGAVDERPVRVGAEMLDGAALDDEGAFAALAEAAAEAVEPVDDLSGSEDYKRHLTGVLAKRAVQALGDV